MIRRLLYFPFFVFILLIALGSFLLTTTPGIYLSLSLAKPFIPGSLEIKKAKGRLLDTMSFAELDYTYKNIQLKLKEVNLTWHLRELLQKKMDNISLHAVSGEVGIKTQTPYPIARLNLLGSLSRNYLTLNNLSLELDDLRLTQGQLKINLTDSMQVSGQIKVLAKKQKAQGHMTIKGSLNKLNVNVKGELTKPIPSNFQMKAELIPDPSQKPWLKGNFSLIPRDKDSLQNLTIEGKLYGNQFPEAGFLVDLRGGYQGNTLAAKLNYYPNGNFPKQWGNQAIIITKLYPNWQFSGPVTLNKQPINLSGQGIWIPKPQGKIAITARDFNVLNNQNYQIAITPDLHLTLSPTDLALSGEIKVTQANLIINKLINKHPGSEDIIDADAPVEENKPSPLRMQVKLTLGDKVHFNVDGLRGNLAGAIFIAKQPQLPPTATGRLQVLDGQFTLYGQKLNVNQGELLFNGGVLTNPVINLSAVRAFKRASNQFNQANALFDFSNTNLINNAISGDTEVGIRISGTALKPKIALFSIPPNLSQADILSMIILGKPANQANKAGGQLLLGAMSSLNLDKGSKGVQLLQQLKSTLGIDFNVESTPTFNKQTNQVTESNAFVVSKNLSDRLQLSYNVGLGTGDANILILKYLLNKFFSIQVSASDNANGMDLMYSN